MLSAIIIIHKFIYHLGMKHIMASSSYYTYGLGAAAIFLALSEILAFAPIATTPIRYSPSIVGGFAQQPKTTFTLPPLSVLSEDQALHTAERLSGMSRGEIQHIFEDIDADGSGTIDLAELDLLAKYFPGKNTNRVVNEYCKDDIILCS